MAEPVVFVDSSDVREGKLEELKTALEELVSFVESNEPRPISYNIYLNPEGTRMTVVQVHPDPASMEHHMTLAASAFPGFVELLELRTMDIYGEPGEALMKLITGKIELLGDAAAHVHDHHAGFFRVASR